MPVVLLFSEGELCQRLRDAGVKVHVLLLSTEVTDARKDQLNAGSLLRFRQAGSVSGFICRLARQIAVIKPDLIHTNSLKSDVLGGLAGRLMGIPVIWHVRDRIAPDYLPRRVADVFRVLSQRLPSFVIGNSHATLETLRRHNAPASNSEIDPGRYRVVYDGTNHRPRKVAATPARFRPLIGLVGRISPWKGQHVFLRAAARIRQRFTRARFQIIGAPLFGEEAYLDEIRQMRASLGLEDVVEFTGFQADVEPLIDRLDVLVHASTVAEPFGQVIIEGMAAGKPVVATDGGGVPEILHGDAGILVPMGDDKKMADAVCLLLADPCLARKIGDLGRQRVSDFFLMRHTAEGVQQVYDLLFQGKKSRSPRNTTLADGLSMGLGRERLSSSYRSAGHGMERPLAKPFSVALPTNEQASSVM
jgi:glycosyltransferase involved in cell wall biosynthesis